MPGSSPSIRLPLHSGLKPQQPGAKASPLPPPSASRNFVSLDTAAQAANLERVPLLGPAISSAYLTYKRFENLWGSFLPMVALFFFLSFINTLLDSLKDTFVITAAGGGAQVIPYLTVYAVLPSSLLFLLAYSYATNVLSRTAVFNTIIFVFMSFFAFFGLFLYPNHQTLHLHALAETLSATLPSGLAGAVRRQLAPAQPALRCAAAPACPGELRGRRRAGACTAASPRRPAHRPHSPRPPRPSPCRWA